MSWQTINDSDPVARKHHRCIWCGERIDKGQKHHLQAGKMDGDFQSNRYHTECFGAACVFWAEDDDSSFDPHSFKRGTTEGR